MQRRDFLKRIAVTAGSLAAVPTLLKGSALAQQATEVSLYARLAGSQQPPINLFSMDSDAWICLGEKVELFWVTTPDVGQIDLGRDAGVFAADQGGNDNGLNWGSTVVEPTSHTSYQIFALDGNYEAGNAADVRVFGQPRGAGPFQVVEEETFDARLVSRVSVRTDKIDTWQAVLPKERFSEQLSITFIKPVGRALDAAPADWNVVKTDLDNTQHLFKLAAANNYQNPFTLAGTNLTLPLSGTWNFSTIGQAVSRNVSFRVKPVCA